MGQIEVRSDVAFEFEGFWWDPNKNGQSEPTYGHVRFEPSIGITLNLVEWQGEYDGLAERDLAVLHGQTLTGAPCTIFDLINVQSTGHFPAGHRGSEWHSSVMAYGALINDRDAVPVRKVKVSWRGLSEWLATATQDHKGSRAGLGRDDVFEVELEGTKFIFGFERTEANDRFTDHQTWTGSVTVELTEPIALSEFAQSYLTPLRNLILFGTSEETVLRSLVLLRLDEIESGLIGEARALTEWVVQDAARPLTVRRNPYAHLLMPLAAWSSDTGGFVGRWFKLHADLGEAANLFFGTLNNRPGYLETWFLNLASFTEVYHRTLHNEPPLTQGAHQASVSQMLDALPEEKLREHYERRLEHADEQGFRSRIKQLFRRAEEAVDGVKLWRKADLPDELLETRNNLTHRAGAGDGTLEGSNLFWATKRLLVVLEINIMLDLELPLDVVAGCITQRYINDVGVFGAA